MTKTVLIVDDSAMMRKMLGETLRAAGFAVVEGANGSDGLVQLDRQPVQMVITDFNMPRMNGPALIRRIRERPDYRFTPILVLTTETEDARKQEGKAAGATGWMVKPFDPPRLVQIVNRLLP
ncbi:response regulator [Limnoglobus roseus]|uniref:Response regulator n=1 Tax=Limnoglobus roseus TaxID=2598579 RepID=A0A5C1ANL8_9BACT|nr:response regulator [Limnoglobus roseus]QEL20590.1 response regulator [Limnoglobus roseus]